MVLPTHSTHMQPKIWMVRDSETNVASGKVPTLFVLVIESIEKKFNLVSQSESS